MERKEAVALGLRTYDTGRECKNGHLSPRNTISGDCTACYSDRLASIRNDTARANRALKKREAYANMSEEDRKKAREKANQRYAENPEKYKYYARKYYEDNAEVILDRAKARRLKIKELIK